MAAGRLDFFDVGAVDTRDELERTRAQSVAAEEGAERKEPLADIHRYKSVKAVTQTVVAAPGGAALEYRRMIQKTLHMTYKLARRIVIGVVGATVLLIGIVMMVAPGPALIVIPLGLAILSLEFAWARHWLKKVRERISREVRSRQKNRAEAHRQRATPEP